MELNNRGWELVEKDGRSAEETPEMLHAAHAAGIGLVGYALIGAALMIPAMAVSLKLGRAFERRQPGPT